MSYKYFGLWSTLIAWLLVVLPAWLSHIDFTHHDISRATGHKFAGFIIKFSLILGACFQALFLLYLVDQSRPLLPNFGPWLFLSCNVATVLTALFTQSHSPRHHHFFVRYYFLVMPFAQILVTAQVRFSILIACIYYLGILVILKKFKTENALIELWAFLWLSIWTIYMTFIP